MNASDGMSNIKGSNTNTQKNPAITKKATSVSTNHYNQKTWKNQLAEIRFHLDQISLRPSIAAKTIIDILSKFKIISSNPDILHWSTAPLDGRVEVLSVIKHCAPPEFYSSWMKYGLDVIESWFVEAVLHVQAKKANGLKAGTVPGPTQQQEQICLYVLEMLEKLPLTVPILKLHKYGKFIRQINMGGNSSLFSPNVIQVSNALETKWRKWVKEDKSQPTVRSEEETPAPLTFPISSTSNLVQAEDVVASTPGNITATQSSSKRPGSPSSENGQAKRHKTTTSTRITQSGIIGRPRNAELPNLTHAETTYNSSQTGQPANPFTHALDLLQQKKANKDPIELDDHLAKPADTGSQGKKTQKPSRSVRFRSPNRLCQTKVVERLVYEDEEYGSIDQKPQIFDVPEGEYLHRGNFVAVEGNVECGNSVAVEGDRECTNSVAVEGDLECGNFVAAEGDMEWKTPLEVILTQDTIRNLETCPLESKAALIQEEREKAQQAVKFEEDDVIPQTPIEPFENISDSYRDKHRKKPPKMMKLSEELIADPEVSQWIARVHASHTNEGSPATEQTVADLLDRLDTDSSIALGLSDSSFTRRKYSTTTDWNQSSKYKEPYSFNSSMSSRSIGTNRHPPLTSTSRATENHYPRPRSDFPVDRIGSQRSLDQSNSDTVLSAQKKKKKKHGTSRTDRSHIPCRYGSLCAYGEQCRYKHR